MLANGNELECRNGQENENCYLGFRFKDWGKEDGKYRAIGDYIGTAIRIRCFFLR